jgi:hypothetical protein
VGVGNASDRETRGDDQQALEEIRRLFERYRRTARHGMVAERDEPADLQDEETEAAPALTGR